MTHPLEELAACCEKAERPDRELDERIGMAIGLKNTIRVGHECLGNDRTVPVTCPYYTRSLDAAMTLAEGMLLVQMSDIAADGLPAVCLCSDTSATPPTEHWGIALASGPRREQLARALVAASLRARAAVGEG